MKSTLSRFTSSAVALGTVGLVGAQTYGNTSPFETVSNHSPNYVLGVQVTIPVTLTLQSFGLIYGITGETPTASNAIFGLYASSPSNGLPTTRVAVTNPINVN